MGIPKEIWKIECAAKKFTCIIGAVRLFMRTCIRKSEQRDLEEMVNLSAWGTFSDACLVENAEKLFGIFTALCFRRSVTDT